MRVSEMILRGTVLAGFVQGGVMVSHILENRRLASLVDTHVKGPSQELAKFRGKPVVDTVEAGAGDIGSQVVYDAATPQPRLVTAKLFTQVISPLDEAITGLVKDALAGENGTVILRPESGARTLFGRKWIDNIRVTTEGHRTHIVRNSTRDTTGRGAHYPKEVFVLTIDPTHQRVNSVIYVATDKDNETRSGLVNRRHRPRDDDTRTSVNNTIIAEASAHLLERINQLSKTNGRIVIPRRVHRN